MAITIQDVTTKTPISLLALRAFEAAARHISFTAAAGELHVSIAAISRHVRVLEASIGRQLFRRLHRRVELTAAGKWLGGELSTCFQRIDRAIQTSCGVSMQRLRLTAEQTFASRWLIPRLEGFAVTHPDFELELDTTDELRTLGRDADVAIRWFPDSKKRRAKGDFLFAIAGVPVIRGVRPRPEGWQSDASIRGYTLLHDDDGRAWRSWFAAAQLNGFSDARHRYFSDTLPALSAAEQGQGVALGFEPFIQTQLHAGELLRIGQTYIRSGAYYLLEARNRATFRGRAAFSRWIKAEIGSPAVAP